MQCNVEQMYALLEQIFECKVLQCNVHNSWWEQSGLKYEALKERRQHVAAPNALVLALALVLSIGQ